MARKSTAISCQTDHGTSKIFWCLSLKLTSSYYLFLLLSCFIIFGCLVLGFSLSFTHPTPGGKKRYFQLNSPERYLWSFRSISRFLLHEAKKILSAQQPRKISLEFSLSFTLPTPWGKKKRYFQLNSSERYLYLSKFSFQQQPRKEGTYGPWLDALSPWRLHCKWHIGT